MDPKILVALSTGEHIRKASFLPSFLSINKPAGTMITTIHGQSPAKARNIAFQQALEMNSTHVFLVDDDMILPPDVIERLLAHDKPVVTALYLMRDFPHIPCLFSKGFDDGFCEFRLFGVNGEDEPRLVPAANMGFGCVLIKTEVIRALEEYAPYWVTLGEITKDGWCDDVAFFNKVRNKGIEMFCDTSVVAGHMTTVSIFPKYINGNWYTEYQSPTGNALIPQTTPPVPATGVTSEEAKDGVQLREECVGKSQAAS